MWMITWMAMGTAPSRLAVAIPPRHLRPCRFTTYLLVSVSIQNQYSHPQERKSRAASGRPTWHGLLLLARSTTGPPRERRLAVWRLQSRNAIFGFVLIPPSGAKKIKRLWREWEAPLGAVSSLSSSPQCPWLRTLPTAEINCGTRLESLWSSPSIQKSVAASRKAMCFSS